MSDTKKLLENIQNNLKESDKDKEELYSGLVVCGRCLKAIKSKEEILDSDIEEEIPDRYIEIVDNDTGAELGYCMLCGDKYEVSDLFYIKPGKLKELDKLKESDEPTEEQPQKENQEEPANDSEQFSPEVQEILNNLSSVDAMHKWVIEDVLDDDIEGYSGDTMDEKLKARLNEITEHGCQSGTVGSLIYYTDTVQFFNDFYDEIYDMVESIGADSILEMLEQKCEKIDIIMGADTVKNYLAWMAYEEVCFLVAEELATM